MVMATSCRTATARLCRAPGFRRTMSPSPPSIRRRTDSLIWRTESAAQSSAIISGAPAHSPHASHRRSAAELPEPRGTGARLARLVPAAQRGLERDLLVRDGDGAVAFGDDQRLQAEGILGEPECVGGRRP